MKLNCGPSKKVRVQRRYDAAEREAVRLRNWHRHFCLIPTRVAEGDCRWLEWVDRKFDYTFCVRSMFNANHFDVHTEFVSYRTLDNNTSGLAPA